jgi:hypothetical protein
MKEDVHLPTCPGGDQCQAEKDDHGHLATAGWRSPPDVYYNDNDKIIYYTSAECVGCTTERDQGRARRQRRRDKEGDGDDDDGGAAGGKRKGPTDGNYPEGGEKRTRYYDQYKNAFIEAR